LQISGRYWRERFAGLPELFEQSSCHTLLVTGRIINFAEFGILNLLLERIYHRRGKLIRPFVVGKVSEKPDSFSGAVFVAEPRDRRRSRR
jgi:hypothetical protein